MGRRTFGLLLLAGLVGLCGVVNAQSVKTNTIVLKVYDGKSGKPVVPTGYQVRVDHLTMLHPDWVKQNDDGSAEMTIPAESSVVRSISHMTTRWRFTWPATLKRMLSATFGTRSQRS